MLESINTVTIFASDLDAAERWYRAILGFDAYFHVPGYVEFRIGAEQHELGIIDAQYSRAKPGAPGGAIVYWRVADLDSMWARLMAAGATEYEPISDRGKGFRTASALDPFGNILGVMTRPHQEHIAKSIESAR